MTKYLPLNYISAWKRSERGAMESWAQVNADFKATWWWRGGTCYSVWKMHDTVVESPNVRGITGNHRKPSQFSLNCLLMVKGTLNWPVPHECPFHLFANQKHAIPMSILQSPFLFSTRHRDLGIIEGLVPILWGLAANYLLSSENEFSIRRSWTSSHISLLAIKKENIRRRSPRLWINLLVVSVRSEFGTYCRKFALHSIF